MIGIIGAGNMGRAIALRLKEKIIISDIDRARLYFKRHKYISAAKDNRTLVDSCGVIILAVKPGQITGVLRQIGPYLKGRLVVSIAAGIESSFIERSVGGRVRVIRVMPNMASMVGRGIAAVSRGRFAGKKDLRRVMGIFSNLGDVVEVRESDMDAVTALSGSGPAYYFLLTAVLEKAGEYCGLDKRLASLLTLKTFIGAAESADKAGITMDELVRRVASKGGTTEAALKVFKSEGFENMVIKAVKAAMNRSRQIR